MPNSIDSQSHALAAALRRRAAVLACAAALLGFMGTIATWSVISSSVHEQVGWPLQWLSLTYSLYTLGSFLFQNVAGWMQRRFAPRTILALASVFVLVGWSAPSFVHEVPALCLGTGFVAGFAQGLCFNTSLAVAARWFPDRKGFANGICVGAMGLSSLVIAPAVGVLMSSAGVFSGFRVIAVVLACAVFVFSRFLSFPPEGYAAYVEETAGAAQEHARQTPEDHAPRAAIALVGGPAVLLRQPGFWVMWVVYLCGVAPGAMLIGHASTMGQVLAGLDPAHAALAVSVMAVFNFCGRLGFGALSDRVGRCRTLVAEYLAMCLGLAGLALAPGGVVAFLVALCVTVVGYGGLISTMPATCADAFGEGGFARNFAALFSAFTTGAFIGPNVASFSVSATGSYAGACVFCAVLVALGLGLIAVLSRMAARRGGAL